MNKRLKYVRLQVSGQVRRRSVHIVLFLVLSAVCCCMGSSKAIAEEQFVAIAFSNINHVCAEGYDVGSLDRAKAQAVAECQKAKGINCRVKIARENGCVALAVAKDGSYGFAGDEEKQGAIDDALTLCRKFNRNCKIRCTACTEK